MPDAFPCNDRRMDPTFKTWPSLDELPEAVGMHPEIFFDQRPGTNQHETTGEVMGLCKIHKKSQEQLDEEAKLEKKRTLEQLCDAVACHGKTACASYVICFEQLDDSDHCHEMEVKTTEEKTLWDLCNNHEVKN